MPGPFVNAGLGTVLSYEDQTTPGTYHPCVQRVSIDGPDMAVGEADATHLDSAFKTRRPTLPDPGDLTFSAFYDPNDTSHTFLFGLVGTPKVINWKLAFHVTPAAVASFAGFLKGFKPNGMEAESNLGVDVTIALTSMPVIATT